ncbi:Endoribonuclease L-PSP [Pseudomonas syringae pv. avellanae str. ISPaVe013]|uniref:RidA family protein n=1 Tax=Pseudomonas syringae TaxID=317 RepID=UPI00028EE031|nr:RidA family protein [Pseudomonas syringae]EKG41509.1 Endoribonuclease L-PSP [Pseudomonas syringae pv. avellanae str. ISPaVe013]
MSDRELIIPPTMQSIMDRAGYAPAVRVGDTLYCAGQVGRTRDMEVILNPEAQFIACWENLRTVLAEGGCTFEDIVDMTTYHVAMSEHMAVFRDVKNRIFPRGQCAWTCIGVAELAHPGLLLEIKCVAVRRHNA